MCYLMPAAVHSHTYTSHKFVYKYINIVCACARLRASVFKKRIQVEGNMGFNAFALFVARIVAAACYSDIACVLLLLLLILLFQMCICSCV